MGKIGKLTNLQTLGLCNTKVSDAGLKEVGHLSHLTVLSLSNEITEAGLEDTTPFNNLRTLSLGENTNITQKFTDGLMESLPNLLQLCSGKDGNILMRSRPSNEQSLP